MMLIRGGKKGSILLASLLLVLVIGMVGRAVILLGPGALAVSDSSITRAQAQRVAESGLEYAAARLRDNSAWCGSDNRVTVNIPGMVVVEDQGNVIGLVTDSEGAVSQFRLRFNFQDGDPGADSLPDPIVKNKVNIPFVSINNIRGEEMLIPMADEGTWTVTKPTQGVHVLPAGGVYLTVEGRAGKGLNHQSASEPNAPVQGPVSRFVAEAYLEVSLNDPTGRASMMGGGDIAFKVSKNGKVSVKVRGARGNEGVVPRLRSKGAVTVDSLGSQGPLQMVQGEVARDAAKPPGFDAKVEGTVSLLQENVGDGKDFFNLKWDDVAKADPDPATTKAVHIPGGTYVHWDNGSIHYYDMSLADYRTYMAVPANQTDPGVKVSPKLKEIRSSSNLAANPTGLQVSSSVNPYTGEWSSTWAITKDLFINASANGVESMAVIPRSGASYSPTDNADVIPLASPDAYKTQQIVFDMKGATVSANDDVAIFARVNGHNATITGAGGLKVITADAELKSKGKGGDAGGKSKTNPLDKPKLQLNLYVKKDIQISTYDDGNFNKLKLEGLVYAWGSFQALLGDAALNQWNQFVLDGALVAYGADPVTGSPGSAGSGKIDITAEGALITWDDRRMAAIASLGSSRVTLRRTLYNYR